MTDTSANAQVGPANAPAFTMWMGLPPDFAAHSSFPALFQDVVALLRPLGVGSAESNEPRRYELSDRGIQLLIDGALHGRIGQLALETSADADSNGRALCTLHLAGRATTTPLAAGLGVVVHPPSSVSGEECIGKLTNFVLRWFASSNAASAFVSYSSLSNGRRLGDTPTVTAHESQNGRGVIRSWRALQRYARGAAWGVGLGPELLRYMGGQQSVVASAPCDATPVGDGVWLQLPGTPPPKAPHQAALAKFLSPLLDWSRDERLALDGPAATVTRPPRPRPSRARPRVHVVPPVDLRVDDFGTTTGINIHLVNPPDETTVANITELIGSWRLAYADPGAKIGIIHDMHGPTVDGVVLRWSIDFGSVNQHQSIAELAERLAALGPEISRIFVGVEGAG